MEELEWSSHIGQWLDLPNGGFGVMIGPEVQIGDGAIIFNDVAVDHVKAGQ